MNRRSFLKLASNTTGGLLASYLLFFERSSIQLNRYKIPVPNLPESFENFTIVHLTDFHYGHLLSNIPINSIVERVNLLKKDLIVCTGDYVNGNAGSRSIDTVWSALSKLTSMNGVLATLGNHDHWSNARRTEFWLNRTNSNLRRQITSIQRGADKLWFIGAGDLWEDYCDLDYLTRNIPEADCKIVLAHNPDSADINFDSRFDLFVCGHTHGGQVNIPFIGTPAVPVNNTNYNSGLKFSPKGFPIFISKGLGWSTIPVRFNCYPEIAMLELTRTLNDAEIKEL
jgi:predicted MPP superfamily phosphohydrolase